MLNLTERSLLPFKPRGDEEQNIKIEVQQGCLWCGDSFGIIVVISIRACFNRDLFSKAVFVKYL